MDVVQVREKDALGWEHWILRDRRVRVSYIGTSGIELVEVRDRSVGTYSVLHLGRQDILPQSFNEALGR